MKIYQSGFKIRNKYTDCESTVRIQKTVFKYLSHELARNEVRIKQGAVQQECYTENNQWYKKQQA